MGLIRSLGKKKKSVFTTRVNLEPENSNKQRVVCKGWLFRGKSSTVTKKKKRRKTAFSKDCNPALYTEGLEELGVHSGQCNALSQRLSEQVWGQLGLRGER